jgi:hypothetical protein
MKIKIYKHNEYNHLYIFHPGTEIKTKLIIHPNRVSVQLLNDDRDILHTFRIPDFFEMLFPAIMLKNGEQGIFEILPLKDDNGYAILREKKEVVHETSQNCARYRTS